MTAPYPLFLSNSNVQCTLLLLVSMKLILYAARCTHRWWCFTCQDSLPFLKVLSVIAQRSRNPIPSQNASGKTIWFLSVLASICFSIDDGGAILNDVWFQDAVRLCCSFSPLLLGKLLLYCFWMEADGASCCFWMEADGASCCSSIFCRPLFSFGWTLSGIHLAHTLWV